MIKVFYFHASSQQRRTSNKTPTRQCYRQRFPIFLSPLHPPFSCTFDIPSSTSRSFLNRGMFNRRNEKCLQDSFNSRSVTCNFLAVILLASQSCASSRVAPAGVGRPSWKSIGGGTEEGGGWAGQNGPPRALKTIVFNVIG